MFSQDNIGNIITLDLAAMYEYGLKDPDLINQAQMRHGFVIWSGNGKTPEMSTVNYYDWIDAITGERLIGVDDGTLTLEILDIDETEEYIDAQRPDMPWSPHACFSFEEVEQFATFE